jgi:flagellin FlaB
MEGKQMITKFMKAVRNLHKKERGMTGLETAIILIAFVTVAAVFSYAVLSAGLFAAERGKETVYVGLAQAKSNLELSGSCIATSSDNLTVEYIKITVRNAIAGNPIDMTECTGVAGSQNKCVISVSTAADYLNNVKWTRQSIGATDGDNLLETGEQFEITIATADLGTGLTLSSPIVCNSTVNIQVKPSLGSTITVQRTFPPQIDPVMDLH